MHNVERSHKGSSLKKTIILFLFFFNDTATTEIYTLSLHDALPIYDAGSFRGIPRQGTRTRNDGYPSLLQRARRPERRVLPRRSIAGAALLARTHLRFVVRQDPAAGRGVEVHPSFLRGHWPGQPSGCGGSSQAGPNPGAAGGDPPAGSHPHRGGATSGLRTNARGEIGRAACRERV